MCDDYNDKMLALAGEIANDIIKSNPVKYGYHSYEVYTMADAQEYLLIQDDMCVRLSNIHRAFMDAVEDPDKAVQAQIDMDQLTFDAVGGFAESVVSRVYNYRVQDGIERNAAI